MHATANGAFRTGTFAAVVAAALLCLFLPGGAAAFTDEEVRAIVGNQKQAEDYPGQGGIWMARQKRVEIDGVGNAAISEHLLARIFDPEWGREQFLPYRRAFWAEGTSVRTGRVRVWKSRTEFRDIPSSALEDALHPDVEGVVYQRYYRELRLALPELDPGDVVEIELFWTERIPSYEYNVRWLEHTFGDEVPVVEEQLIVAIPMAAKIQVDQVGPKVPNRVVSRNAVRIQTWITGNLPALSHEVMKTPWSSLILGHPGPDDSISRVVFSTVVTWEYLSSYYGEQWEWSMRERGPEMDRIISSAIQGVPDPSERARILERHVREEIGTFPIPTPRLPMRPLQSEFTAREGAGSPRDKACLLASLLRMAGIPAQVALVRTRGGAWSPQVPSPAQLDIFLVRARPPGRDEMWLSPVESPAGPGPALILTGEEPGTWVEGEAGLIEFPGLGSRE